MNKQNTTYVLLALATLVLGGACVKKAGDGFREFQKSQSATLTEAVDAAQGK